MCHLPVPVLIPRSRVILSFVFEAGMEFVIPSSREELRKDEGKGIYIVKQTFESDELAVVLDGVKILEVSNIQSSLP